MSNLFKYTKRVLTSVLAAAVVLTAIPSTAFGAEQLDEDLAVVTLQDDAQEAEVAEEASEGVEVENNEDAFAVDGVSGDEEVETGEEVQEPDKLDSENRLLAIHGKLTPSAGEFFENITTTYGTESGAVTITVDDIYPDAAVTPYKKANFELKNFVKGKGVANIAYTKEGAKRTMDEALADAEANADLVNDTAVTLPYGYSASGENGVFTISGIPKQVGTFQYALKITDSENTGNAALYYGIKFVITAKANAVTIKSAGSDGAAAETGAGEPEQAEYGLNDKLTWKVNFGSKKIGYEVVDSGATGNKLNKASLVLNSSVLGASSIEDLSVTVTDKIGNTQAAANDAYDEGDASTDFEWQLKYTSAENKFDASNPVTLVVWPKTGLTSSTTKYLHIRSEKALGNWKNNELVVKLLFEVTSNVTLSATVAGEDIDLSTTGDGYIPKAVATGDPVTGLFKVKSNGSDYEAATGTAAAGTTYYEKVAAVDLGTKPVGKSFNDIVIKAAGGAGDLKMTTAQSSILTKFGIEGKNKTVDSTHATWTVSGAVNPTDLTKVGKTITFGVTATDTIGGGETVYFNLTAAPSDTLSFSINGTALKGTTPSFDWSAADGAELDDCFATLTMSNSGAVDMYVTGAFTTGGKFRLDKTFTKVKVPKAVDGVAGTTEIKITPMIATPSDTLTLSGDGLTSVAISLSFSRSSRQLEIVAPKPTSYAATITAAELGKDYSYTFSAVKTGTLSNIEWSVLTAKEFNDYCDDNAGATNNLAALKTAVSASTTATTDTTAAELKKWFGLEMNDGTGVLAGSMIPAVDPDSATSPKSVYKNHNNQLISKVGESYTFVVMAKCTTSGGEVYDAVKITMGSVAPTKALKAVSGTTTLFGDTGATKRLDLGTIKINNEKGASAKVDVSNLTRLDLTDVKAQITKLEYKQGNETVYGHATTTAADIVKYFVLSPEGATKDLTPTYPVAVGESMTFQVKTLAPVAVAETDNKLIPGSYRATIELTGANVGNNTAETNNKYEFVAYVTVEDAPTISANFNVANTLTVDTEVKDSDNVGFIATSSDTTKEFEFAWEDAEGSLNEIATAKSGLTLSKAGKITGTPLKAGEYKVNVKVNEKGKTEVVASKEFTLKVKGKVTLENLIIGTGAEKAIADNNDAAVYVLPGFVVGGTQVSEQVEFSVKDTADHFAAKDLVVTVTDADDDRTDAAAIAKSPANPYIGSKNVIGVSASADTYSIGTVAALNKGHFDVFSKGTPAAGEYKVKVTISGSNVTERTFFVYLVVANKFEFTETSVSSNLALGDPKKITLTTRGGVKGQTIKWAEVQKKATEKTNGIPKGQSLNYLAGQAAAVATKTEVDQETITGAGITGLGISIFTDSVIGHPTNDNVGKEYIATIGRKTTASATADFDKEGAPTKAGTFATKVKAYVDAVDFNTTGHKNAGEFINKSGAIPKQEAVIPVTLTIAGTDNIRVTKIVGDNLNPDPLLAPLWYKSPGVQGTPLGEDDWNPITGYVMMNDTEAYTADPSTKDVTVTLQSLAQQNVTFKAELEKGANSNFELVGAVTDPTDEDYLKRKNITVAASADGVVMGAANTDVVIRPKKGLKKSATPYTDKVIIKSDDFNGQITVNVSFTVEEKTLLTDVSYGTTTAPGYNHANPDKYDTKVATANVVSKEIKLTDLVAEGVAVNNETIYIKNTGNTNITNLAIAEIDDNGDEINGASSMITLGALSATTLAPKAEANVTIKPAKNVAGEYTTKAQISFKESATSLTTVKFPITVKYVVYDKEVTNVTVTPDTTKALTSQAEGYTPEVTEYKIVNGNATGSTKGIYAVKVEFTDAPSAQNFRLTSSSSAATVNAAETEITFKSIAAAAEDSFKVEPRKGLVAGTYAADMKISAGNLKAPITRKVTFTVTKSASFVTDVYPTVGGGAPTAINALKPGRISNTISGDFAKRLWNSVVVGMTASSDYVAGITSDKKTATLDLDKNGHTDVTITFTDPSSTAAAATITGATVVRTGAISMESPKVTLTAADKTRISDAAPAIKTDEYFTDMTFNLFSIVTLTTGDEKVWTVDDATVLANNNVFIPTASIETNLSTYKKYNGKVGNTGSSVDFYAIVPNGTLASNVFTAKTLPVVETKDKANEGWMYGSNIITDKSLVSEDVTYTPAWHYHKYPASFDEDVDHQNPNVKWTWTGNATDGYTAATVTIVCTDQCPDPKKGELVLPATIDKKVAKADCEHGERIEYVATRTQGTSIYTSKRITNEGEPLGHDWEAPVITWADKGSGKNGEYATTDVTVTRTCKRDATHKVTLTIVSVNENEKVEPTCDKDGSVTYTVTYTDVDKAGKPAGNVTTDVKDGKKVILTAKGHNEKPELTVENFDDKTLKAIVTATCPDCKKVLFGPAELTGVEKADGSYDFTFTSTVDGKTYTVNWFNHQHKWSKPVWYWEGPTKATATFTCTVGKETKSVVATPTFVKENGKGDKQYLASVVGPDSQTYSDTQWYDKDGNPTSGEGIGIEGIEEEYNYTGKPIKPEPTVIDYGADKVLVKGTDYSVSYKDNKSVGTATIIVKGKGNYGEKGGEIQKTFKIIDPIGGEEPSNFTVVKGLKTSTEKLYYNGEAQAPATLTITTDGSPLTATWNKSTAEYEFSETPSKDVKIFVTNNVNKGSGLIAVHGVDAKGKWTVKTKTFSIKACEMDNGDNFTVTADDAVWGVKGAIPNVTVSYMSTELKEGVDYTLSFKNNKKVGENVAQVIVKGKGNFTKKNDAAKFTVNPFEITEIKEITAYDGLKRSKVAVTITDPYGNIVPAKNYTVTASGTGDKLVKGESIDVTVTGKTSEVTGSQTEANYEIGTNLAKVKVTVPKTFYKQYEGKAVELTEDDFGSGKIQVGDLTYGTDFQITRYQNNTKKGTMTVYIVGVSEKASGIGKFKVKITPAKIKPAE